MKLEEFLFVVMTAMSVEAPLFHVPPCMSRGTLHAAGGHMASPVWSKSLTASEFEASTQHCGSAHLASERGLEHYLYWNIFFPKIIAFCLRISS